MSRQEISLGGVSLSLGATHAAPSRYRVMMFPMLNFSIGEMHNTEPKMKRFD